MIHYPINGTIQLQSVNHVTALLYVLVRYHPRKDVPNARDNAGTLVQRYAVYTCSGWYVGSLPRSEDSG